MINIKHKLSVFILWIIKQWISFQTKLNICTRTHTLVCTDWHTDSNPRQGWISLEDCQENKSFIMILLRPSAHMATYTYKYTWTQTHTSAHKYVHTHTRTHTSPSAHQRQTIQTVPSARQLCLVQMALIMYILLQSDALKSQYLPMPFTWRYWGYVSVGGWSAKWSVLTYPCIHNF